MVIYLSPKSDAPCDAFWKIAIIDQSGDEKLTQHIVFDDPDDALKYFVVKREHLFDSKNQLLDDDTLTLAFKISTVKDSEMKFQINENKQIDKKEFREIYKQREFTDLSLKFGFKSIKTHRVLLASRSGLLKDRLSELPEDSNFLDLQDTGVEFEVAEQVINFLYDERVDDMEKHAKPLLAAAIKLRMRHLESYCLEHFYNKLNTENVLETLKLSAQFKSDKLQYECIKFIEK